MTLIEKLAVAAVALVAMEGLAYLAHRFLMHGPLWILHESHHRPRSGTFELNDWFAVFFSIPSIVLIYFGVRGNDALLWTGIGILGYGICYFMLHEVLVHRRIRLPYRPKNKYLKRMITAHWLHHSVRQKEGAVSFGFLYAPPIEELKRQLGRGATASAD